MDAKARIASALQDEAAHVCKGVPEGRERQDAYASWIKLIVRTLGYEEKTINNWINAKHAPVLQAYFDLCDMFPGFEDRVWDRQSLDPSRRGGDQALKDLDNIRSILDNGGGAA